MVAPVPAECVGHLKLLQEKVYPIPIQPFYKERPLALWTGSTFLLFEVVWLQFVRSKDRKITLMFGKGVFGVTIQYERLPSLIDKITYHSVSTAYGAIKEWFE